MTDLTPITQTALNPLTGEVIVLADASVVEVAHFREACRDAARLARDAAMLCDGELETRHREGTLNAPWVKRASSWRWDASMTHEVLSEFVTDGKLTAREADALVPEVMVRKPDGRGLRSLLGRLMASSLDDAALLQRAMREDIRFSITPPVEGDEA